MVPQTLCHPCSNLTDILKHPLRTSIAIDTLDFEEFVVDEKLRIGITVKDFKAIVTHAERLKTSVSAMYSYPTRPMQLAYDEHGMLCEFTLVTIGEYRGSSVTPVPADTRSLSRTASEQQRSQQASRQPSPGPSDSSARETSARAQTPKQRVLVDMPPPVEPASRSFGKDVERQRPTRPTPPPPKASLDPESLFLPADDEEDERIWGEKSYEDEQDVLGWNPHANKVSRGQHLSSHRFVLSCTRRSLLVKAFIASVRTKRPHLRIFEHGRRTVICESLRLKSFLTWASK